ncbi:shikimate kinase [Bengtsoniella intestinalis]|uniref:shikimate kinase n=1 Tax=Bengtsoniella intestinalis TaxID=3073143 RepID=UPI00391F874B
MTKPLQNITLIGMPGSGKSTVGVLLAKALGFGFLDTDLVIQHRENTKLQTLVDTLGVDGFLDIEQAAIQTVDCIHHVVSPVAAWSVAMRPFLI